MSGDSAGPAFSRGIRLVDRVGPDALSRATRALERATELNRHPWANDSARVELQRLAARRAGDAPAERDAPGR